MSSAGSRLRAIIGSISSSRIGHRVICIVVGVLALYLSCWLLLRFLPWKGDESLEQIQFSRIFTDRYGGELFISAVDDEGLRRIWMPIEEVPDSFLKLLLRAEDRRFYWHVGVDPFSLLAAAGAYLFAGESSTEASAPSKRGASTISMQLASILVPRPPGLGNKFREIIDALRLETRLGKREILELYVNLVPMGANVEGFPAASRRFFGQSLSLLQAEQFVSLVLVPRAPTANNPLHAGNVPPAAAELLNWYWNQIGNSKTPGDQAGRSADGDAEAHELTSRPHAVEGSALHILQKFYGQYEAMTPVPWPFLAPHFVSFVEAQVDWENLPPGSPIYTTLDPILQRRLEARLAEAVEDARQYRIGNAAGLLVDPQTGEVLAYAGSADFSDEQSSGQIDGVQILRQPGSTLKPFLYASALEEGFTASTILPDLPMDFGTDEVYRPENFNEQFHGPVTLRQALSASLNVPAVYTLERLSVDSFYRRLRSLGFASLESQQDQLGVSLALGGADVSLYELVGAYRSFYTLGTFSPLSVILPDARNSGENNHQYRRSRASDEEGNRVWLPGTSVIVMDMLSSHDMRVMTFGRRSPLRFDFPVYMKTGTSNQFNNIWAVAYSADIGGGIWMGNFAGETVMGAPGSSLPAEVLHGLIEEHSSKADLPGANVELEEVQICAVSGMRAHEGCSLVRTELFLPGTVPDYCTWHDRDGRLTYPQEYQQWAQQYGYNVAFQENAPLAIVGPQDGSVFYMDSMLAPESQQLRFFMNGSGQGIFRVDGKLLFNGQLPEQLFWPMERGTHRFTLETPGEFQEISIQVY